MIRSFIYFIKLIFTQKDVIVSLAKREVAALYVGSFLGFIWTFVHPIIMIFVFWVVFSVGFRVRPMNDVPFVVWLTAGMTAWFLFADIITRSADAVVANSHLIKKTVFPSQILPVVHVVSSLVTHSIFLSVLIGLILIQSMPVSLFYLQFLYYLFCLCVLALGLGWAIAALNVFLRDIGHIVSIIVQIGFWATPIFWDLRIMPPGVQFALKMNPMFYIVQGYRESFIYFCPFWEHPYQTLYFWMVTAVIFTGGALIFRRLKPTFADVL